MPSDNSFAATRQLNMNLQEPESAVENPQNTQEVYLGSYSSILHENIGAYVVVEFLIGTERIIVKEGILYNAGNNFITLYNDIENYYTVCDLYSIKFVNFFDPASLRRRTQAELLGMSENRNTSLPIYYTTVAPGETASPPSPPSGNLTTAIGGPVPNPLGR